MALRHSLLALGLFLLAATAGVRPAAGDELVLKNGQKVVGTIVGFENGMFRVQTDYGIALVRKDKVASIKISSSGEATAKPQEAKEPSGKSRPAEATSEEPSEEGRANSRGVSRAEPAATPSPAPVSHPVNQPLPTHLQEHVEGTTYFSDTFHFAMFKPPDWKIYEGVPRETGSGIMAMGTQDERTLLMVDRQVWSGTPDLKADRVIGALRRTYQEFQRLSEEPTQCDGHPAIRRTFTGVLDGAEWHGIAVHVAEGNTVFGIIGLTSAELSGFQQAVLNKIIKSFHFVTPPSSPTAQAPAGDAP
jgi:hypothetical protein